MSILSLLSAITATAFTIGAIYCLTRTRKKKLNVFSFLVLLSLGWWSFCHIFFFAAESAENALFWHRLASVGWTEFAAETTYYFIVLTGQDRHMKKWYCQVAFYLAPVILLVNNLFGATTSLSEKIVRSKVGNAWGFQNSVGNPWLWLYLLYFVVYFGFSFFLLLRWAFRVKHRMKKVMAVSFVTLDAFTILLGLTTDILSPLTGCYFPAVANLCTAVFGVGYFVIIVRFDLFNFRNVVSDRAIIEHSMEPLMVTDEEGEILDANNACTELFCRDRDKLIGMKTYDFVGEAAYTLVSTPLKSSEKVRGMEIPLALGNGVQKQLLISGAEIRDKKNQYLGTVLSMRDVTMIHDLSEKYRWLAFADALTGLPNRRKTFDYLKKCEESYIESGRDFFILYIDLNDFKSVNDRYGHNMGDKFLSAVANRLRECIGGDIGFLGRLSGDEFLMAGILKGEHTDLSSLIKIVEEKFGTEFCIGDVSIKSGISIGGALFSEHKDIDSMVLYADEQMYKMKQEKKRT